MPTKHSYSGFYFANYLDVRYKEIKSRPLKFLLTFIEINTLNKSYNNLQNVCCIGLENVTFYKRENQPFKECAVLDIMIVYFYKFTL